MGPIPSRALLCQCPTHRESKIHPRRHISAFSSPDRLVCDELCQKVQRGLPDEKSKARRRLSVIQVSSKSLQQKDV